MRRLLRSRGQAVVELAIILPFFALLVLGGLDAGRAYYYTTTLTGAAREGVRVGANPLATTASIQDATVAAAPDLAGLTASDVNVATTGTFSPDPQVPEIVTVTVTWTFTPVTPLVSNLFSGGRATLVGVAEGPVI